MIKEVEELCAEVQAHPLAWQRELLDNGEVGVDEIRTDDGDARRVAQFAGGGRNEAGWIDPLRLPEEAMVRVVSVATGNLVRPVPVVGIAAGIEADAGLVKAVDERDWKTGRDSLDQRQLPVADDGVGCIVPSAAELLAAAKGQVINDAGGEAVIEIDLG